MTVEAEYQEFLNELEAERQEAIDVQCKQLGLHIWTHYYGGYTVCSRCGEELDSKEESNEDIAKRENNAIDAQERSHNKRGAL